LSDLLQKTVFLLAYGKQKMLFLAEHQPKFPKRAKEKQKLILRKTKPKRKQRKEENRNNIRNNIATVKTACEKPTTEGTRNTSER
jgi:hypothetical protein